MAARHGGWGRLWDDVLRYAAHLLLIPLAEARRRRSMEQRARVARSKDHPAVAR